MYNKRQIGAQKETLAAKYLEEKGYFIIEKNYRVRQGEIDLVARDGACIVFVEVKYRTDEGCGSALEAVTLQKQKQICKTAYFYLNQKKISPDNTPIRFDVVGITGHKIEHIENAFDFQA
ncbi:MAG: YraN family protein [Wujia sp.]